MIKVGLTGGIGSGKSTIADFFEKKGIPVYYADETAKKLMVSEISLKSGIINLFGPESYQGGMLNRAYIASRVFGNSGNLEKLNALVHPAVQNHYEEWCKNQSSPYIVKEAAILFENGAHKHCDFTILVTAPKELRIQRVQKRDGTSRDQILARMSAQWEDYRKAALADCVIRNIDIDQTISEIERIHTHLLRRIEKGWN